MYLTRRYVHSYDGYSVYDSNDNYDPYVFVEIKVQRYEIAILKNV